MKWCCVEGPGPEWVRSAALDDEGTVFVPAIITGSEAFALICAVHDGTKMVLDGEHVYLPATWLAMNYPDVSAMCTKIDTRMRAHFSST